MYHILQHVKIIIRIVYYICLVHSAMVEIYLSKKEVIKTNGMKCYNIG